MTVRQEVGGVLPALPSEIGHAPTATAHYPEGVTHITNQLAFMKKDGQVTPLCSRRCW
jgi:hypothetical protein